MKINKSKTKVMVCVKESESTVKITVNEETLVDVRDINHLRSKVTRDNKSKTERKCRIRSLK